MDSTDHTGAAVRELAALTLEHDFLRIDEIQAMFLAAISGPDKFVPKEWLPVIMGTDEALQSDIVLPVDCGVPADVQQRLLELLESVAAEWRQDLSGGALPPFCLLPDENGDDDYAAWCNAYLYALDILPTDWFTHENSDDFEDLFYPIMALGAEESGDDVLQAAFAKTVGSERSDLMDDAADAVFAVYRYWQARKNKPATFRRQGEKIGRNEPCPCGSGKKYKACCGKN